LSLIELATCHITQETNYGQKSDWRVISNSKKLLATLPRVLNEKEAMSIIHIARKFELLAFNIGVQFGKKQGSQEKNNALIKELRERNNILSDELNKHIGV